MTAGAVGDGSYAAAMSAVRIGVAERRARLAARHHLAPASRAVDVAATVRDLIALHATDPASVYLSAWARVRGFQVSQLDHALYEDRTLVRVMGMRRTMFVLPAELVPVVLAACTRAIAVVERRKTVQFLSEAGFADDVPAWLEDVERSTLAALAARGPALSAELSADVPRLAQQMVLARGKSYEGKQSVATRVLPLSAARVLAVDAVSVGLDRGLAAGWPGRPARRIVAGRTRPSLVAGLRSGTGWRPQVVDRVEPRADQSGTR